MYSKSDLMLT